MLSPAMPAAATPCQRQAGRPESLGRTWRPDQGLTGGSRGSLLALFGGHRRSGQAFESRAPLACLLCQSLSSPLSLHSCAGAAWEARHGRSEWLDRRAAAGLIWGPSAAAEAMPPLFAPFRALGYITDGSCLAVQRRGKDSFATVSVGKAWQVRCQPTGKRFYGQKQSGSLAASERPCVCGTQGTQCSGSSVRRRTTAPSSRSPWWAQRWVSCRTLCRCARLRAWSALCSAVPTQHQVHRQQGRPHLLRRQGQDPGVQARAQARPTAHCPLLHPPIRPAGHRRCRVDAKGAAALLTERGSLQCPCALDAGDARHTKQTSPGRPHAGLGSTAGTAAT